MELVRDLLSHARRCKSPFPAVDAISFVPRGVGGARAVALSVCNASPGPSARLAVPLPREKSLSCGSAARNGGIDFPRAGRGGGGDRRKWGAASSGGRDRSARKSGTGGERIAQLDGDGRGPKDAQKAISTPSLPQKEAKKCLRARRALSSKNRAMLRHAYRSGGDAFVFEDSISVVHVCKLSSLVLFEGSGMFEVRSSKGEVTVVYRTF
jgi:hypothetical protein